MLVSVRLLKNIVDSFMLTNSNVCAWTKYSKKINILKYYLQF